MVDVVDSWPLLLFWPTVALSVLVAAFGLARRRPRLLLMAAALAGPASAYLALTPRFFVWGLFPGRPVTRLMQPIAATPEDPILLPEIRDQIVLVAVHPASERENEEL